MEMLDLFQMAVKWKASDLSLVAGRPPILRIGGNLIVTELDSLTPSSIEKLIFAIMHENQRKSFIRTKELDFAYSIPGLSRFRINLHYQRGSIAVSVRIISRDIPNIEDLGLPSIVTDIITKTKGLILVTGSTGSGKSTTLAAMLNYLNTNFKRHIITIEDPIEFLHDHKMSIVEQREIGSDTISFYSALKYTLRQDPDVIMVGEMRDLETISMAVTAAETGHLVMSTLHTPSAAETISRIVDVFPGDKQHQIRMQLSSVLEAVIAQHLVPKISGDGCLLILEILITTPAVRNMIRKGDFSQIGSIIETGAAYGMINFERSLENAYKNKLISQTTMANLLSFYKNESIELKESGKRRG